MNEALKKILKFISKFIGFFLINLSLILILLVFFINLSINNIDSLKNDLQNSIQEQIFIQNNINQTELQQAREYCKNNQQDNRCEQLNELEKDGQFNQLFDNIKTAKNYINLSIFFSLILFLFGFVLVYLGTFNILITCYRISVHLTITNFVAALSFKFIPNLFNIILSSREIQELTKEVPREFIEDISGIILNWIRIPVFITVKLTIILGSIFLLVSIGLYFIKKKHLKVKVKDK